VPGVQKYEPEKIFEAGKFGILKDLFEAKD
jgi:hypothetical protein